MRKSKIRSRYSHLGGMSTEHGIVPPRAAAIDSSLRPENDPILKQTLSKEEMAMISENRKVSEAASRRVRSHSRKAANLRRVNQEQREMDMMSAQISSRRRRQVNEDGEVYYIGRATNREAGLAPEGDDPVGGAPHFPNALGVNLAPVNPTPRAKDVAPSSGDADSSGLLAGGDK